MEDTHPKPEQKLASVSKDVKRLKEAISRQLKKVAATGETFLDELESTIHGPGLENKLLIGRDSATALVTLTRGTVDLFANAEEVDDQEFDEEIDFVTEYKNLEYLRKIQSENDEYMKYLNSTSVAIKKLVEKNESDLSKRGSRTESMTSEISFNLASTHGAATSSPY